MAIIKRITKGATDQSVVIQIIDSATGLPETSVAHDTSGIDLWYRRDGAAVVSITEAALTALTDAHSDGGLEPIGNGAYRLDLPDAAVASGVNAVEIGGTITDMIVIGGTVELVDTGVLDPPEILFIDFGGVPRKAINPKTSTDTFIWEIQVKDHNNELVAPDTFTLTLVDQDAADLSARIDDTTPTAVATGRYQVTYTSNSAHAAAQLTLGATAVKSGYVGGIGRTTIMLEVIPHTLAEINAEVLDVLNVDTFAQPGQETPAATTTIRLMLAYCYKMLRNRKAQTATQFSLYNDDAATVDQKATVSDDGTTFASSEIATGP